VIFEFWCANLLDIDELGSFCVGFVTHSNDALIWCFDQLVLPVLQYY